MMFWEMKRDFFATSGIVTNERCGNPECSLQGELPLLRVVCMSPTTRFYARRRNGNLDIRYCIDRVRDRNSGRLYTTNMSPLDEELWLARTGRIMRQKLRKLRLIQTGTSSSFSHLLESTILWHPLPICADY